MRYAIEHSDDVDSLVLVNPVSPYGFGGTKDLEGTPCFGDFAGSGGGLGNEAFVEGSRTATGARVVRTRRGRSSERTTSGRPTSSTRNARNRI